MTVAGPGHLRIARSAPDAAAAQGIVRAVAAGLTTGPGTRAMLVVDATQPITPTRQPSLLAVPLGAAVGLVAGMVGGWLRVRFVRRTSASSREAR